MKLTLLCYLSMLLALLACKKEVPQIAEADTEFTSKSNLSSRKEISKVSILNFGTFHMGNTNDAHKTEFDEKNLDNKRKVHKIANALAKFKPTVIIVERLPKYDKKLLASYNEYIKNPKMSFKNPSEIELLAFEVGRLSNTKRIYGIDHHMDYNYMIGDEIKNQIDATMYNQFDKNPLVYYPQINVNEDKLSLIDKLKLTNQDDYLDFLIETNADILTHAGTNANFEGADEAAKYYQRNLRMYSNLNRIKLEPTDRVFMIMGGSHTAFFRDFIKRSPKYKMVDTFDYLK